MTQSIDLSTHNDAGAKRSLPIAGRQDVDVDAELARFEAEERARLGLEPTEQWVEDMANLIFTKSQKSRITMLIGGLTMAHDMLIGAAFEHLGYNVVALDCPDNDAFRVGKEFGNRAQCNPTYFTVGNLVKALIQLRDVKGMPTKDIIDNYVFLTAGACGPCRFGMYVTEYRKALRDAGFDGFRVMLFQQQGGVKQATGEESGLELGPAFFLGMVKGGIAGDVLNALGYRLRPYEVEAGATDRALAEAKKICADALREGRSIVRALHRCKPLFESVRVDRTRVKPKVAIIGEFWAMTTEGDGNYALQRFLESEGAECDIQLVTAWVLYNLWEVRFDTATRAELRGMDGGTRGLDGSGEYGVLARKVGLWVGDKALRAMFQTFAHAGGLYGYTLPDMDEVARVAAPYYDNELRGGEGHMEVGKLILNVVHQKATMTLSVKPFGCMPSASVSDGVQSLIVEKFPGSIYCAVETSGDGAVNFYSRVQMYLFKAKQAAQAEAEKALSAAGLSMADVEAFLAAHPKYASGLFRADHVGGATVTDLIHAVAYARSTTRLQRARSAAAAVAAAGRRGARAAFEATPAALSTARAGALELAEIAKEAAPGVLAGLTTRAKNRLATVIPIRRPSTEAPAVAAE